MRIYWISSRGQPTRGGSTARGGWDKFLFWKMQKFLLSMSLNEGRLECKSCRYATMETSSLDCSRIMPLYLDCRVRQRAVWTPRHATASYANCARGSTASQSRFHRHYPLQRCFLCVCENVHPATRERDVLSWASHTAQSVPSTQPNVCVDPTAWKTKYHGPRWNSLKQPSFHSLRDTSKAYNLCYPNEKQNTAVVNWHVFSRSQATKLPFHTQRHYCKALPPRQCHKYCRVLLSQNLPFICLTQCNKNCETCALLTL